MSVKLSTEQLLLLNNLMHFKDNPTLKSITHYDGKKVDKA